MTTPQHLIDALVAQTGCDPISAKSLTDFILNAAARNPEIQQALTHANASVRQAAVEAGVQAWFRQGQAFYQELLENKTERAKQHREAIYQSVLASAKA